MSNFLLKNPDLVLIHIPKTGGSTIRNAIWGKSYEGPEYGKFRPEWEGISKVAFVRHPFDRLASAYRDFSDLRGYTKGIAAFVDTACNATIPFLEHGKSTEISIRHHTLPQTHPFNCLDHADITARFETYETDLRRILALVGREVAELPVRRKTEGLPWQDLFADPALRKKAYRFLAEDFEKLGYSPDSAEPVAGASLDQT